MKKILYVLLSLSVVGCILLNIASAKESPDLFEMASILEHENMIINEWSLHAREKLETVQIEQKVDQLMEQFPEWDWEITEDEEKWETTAFSPMEKGVSETIRIISTKTENQAQTYMIYEVLGEGWGEETKELLQASVFEKINDVFHGKPTIFSCVYSEFGDKMNKALPSRVKDLLKAFQAQEIETLEENTFIATTAYSPLFAGMIKGPTEEMNLQLGVRKQGLGGETTLVVGTPIITIEY
ncbi:YwmB family TATA-box binding protein [Bacillus sp. V3B]|uniref:YwmB family TATA-box binding protein n=1 Tax=Bacillus sp. V3B TaxID=2804915 RepID=UPI00210CC8C8|nr:YwmB family TATA-box binding protein [Bacillus sp. V3B]MCQ6274634.1 YwmB family TATA-box binding protein [Bacillus sp. V3B]